MKPTKKPEIPSTADVNTLAGIFGLTPRSIQNLEKQGIAVRIAHGRYDLVASVRNYIQHLEDEAASEDSEFEFQRTRVYRARAEILECQAQAIRGELHDAACIAEVMGDGLANMRAKLLAVPTTAAPRVADETDPNKCAAIIETLLHAAMLECSKYNGREIVNRYLKKQGKLATDAAKDEVEDMEAT